jgi:hypothetical protein
VQAGRLDVGYLRAAATELGLGELLELALELSEPPGTGSE